MTWVEFETQMALIIKDFGPTEFPATRINLIFEHCHDLPEKAFANIVKTFRHTFPIKYPPKPDDFLIAANKHRNHQANKQVDFNIQRGDGLGQILQKFGMKSVSDIVGNKGLQQQVDEYLKEKKKT